MPCPTCVSAQFCSSQCAAAAAVDPASHCPLVCRALSSCNAAGLSDEDQSTLHYTFRACSLYLASLAGDAAAAERCTQISSLAGSSSSRRISSPPLATPLTLPSSLSNEEEEEQEETVHAREMHGRIMRALSTAGVDPSPITLDTVAALLERDYINGYGIAAPSLSAATPDSESDRRLRGSGLYAAASRVNHECLPNAARFDAFDAATPLPSQFNLNSTQPAAAAGSNTALHLRMLHALPAGEEVTQSYFPLTWTFVQRQERCRQQYGFVCRCPRCREEATWPPAERGEEEDDDGKDSVQMGDNDDRGDAPHDSGGGTDDQVVDPGYIHVFLFKFVCPRDGCGGTMAPTGTGGQQQEELICNVCEGTRTEAEFLAELEASSSS